MTARRGFLASSVTVIAAFAGCTGQSGPTTTESAASNATIPTTTTGTTTPSTTTTETETTSSRTTDTTDETSPFEPPELNRTPYPVAWEWNMPRNALGDDSHPRAVLLTADGWQDEVNEAVLSAESRSFLAETDFDSETVVAVQTPAVAKYNRLILRSVDGVGTRTITPTISEWESGSGMNSSPTHLILVRVPNRGVEPTAVDVTWAGLTSGG